MALFTQPCRAMVNDAEECIRLLLRPRLRLLGLINATYFIILRLDIFISNYDNKSLGIIKDATFLYKWTRIVLYIKDLVLRNFFDLFLLNIDACSTSMQPCNIAFDLMLKFGERHTISAYNLSVQK